MLLPWDGSPPHYRVPPTGKHDSAPLYPQGLKDQELLLIKNLSLTSNYLHISPAVNLDESAATSTIVAMRYMNWDVLVFPESGDTTTPLQEFSTACTVIQDPGKQSIGLRLHPQLIEPSSENAAMPIPIHATYFKAVTHPLPTLSCFVPSLLPGSPFRVSIHSWASPVASRATQAMAAHGSQIWFEAKVLLDGVCTAYVTESVYASHRVNVTDQRG